MTLELSTVVNQPAIWLKQTPIAHRALHDEKDGIYENTLSAAARAVAGGYAIEVDLQPSRDGVPMVFHDYTLERLTGITGNTRDLTAAELGRIKIGGTNDVIPTLAELLETVKGKSGLLLELKGQKGADDGFVKAVAETLEGYKGPVTIMSFNHWLLKDARAVAPRLSLGLTAKGDDSAYEEHQKIAEQCNIDFLSYALKTLDCRFVRDFKKTGRPVISWTVRSAKDALRSAEFADQITFGRFIP